MRVLWFSTNSTGYNGGATGGYNGGGWMASLLREFVKEPDLELGVCFVAGTSYREDCQDGVHYYIVPNHRKGLLDKIKDVLYWRNERRDEVNWPHYLEHFNHVLRDFQPDVVEIFGSELYVGLGALSAKALNIPAVLHLQGILTLIHPIFLTPGVSASSYCFHGMNLRIAYSRWQTLNYWRRSIYREKTILRSVGHVIGRTSWDHDAMTVLNPAARYHYGGEILRQEFYEPSSRTLPEKPLIVTTISSAPYKGLDVVLRVAHILRQEVGLDFQWKVFGNVNPTFAESVTGLNHNAEGVELCGVATARQLKDTLTRSTLYFHPSWIENSPNSVAEAQILGLPVVATNVGGIPSMVKDGESGLLFPPTDPYMAASAILQLLSVPERTNEIGLRGQEQAMSRHSRASIAQALLNVYRLIIQENRN